MYRRWITFPILGISMFLASLEVGLAQRGGGGPGGTPGGDKGGGGGMRGGMPSPDQIWASYGGTPDGTTIDLSKNPDAASRMRNKGYTIPNDGIVRKDQFLGEVNQRITRMSGGGGPGGMGPGPGSSTPTAPGIVVIAPGGEEPKPQGGEGRGRGGDRGNGGGDGGGRGWGGGGDGGGRGRGGEDTRKTEDPDDVRPDVLRYGKMPKELPTWFHELDTDKDGMIGLYEWRTAQKSIEDFLTKDANGDGFLTSDEVLKNPQAGSETKGDRSFGGGGKGGNSPSSPGSASPGGNPFDKNKDNNGQPKDKGNKKDEKPKEEKKPDTGENPFTKKKN